MSTKSITCVDPNIPKAHHKKEKESIFVHFTPPPLLFVGHSLTFLPSIGHELSSSLEQTSVSADVVSSQVLPHSPNSPLQNCLETHWAPAVLVAWI